MAARVDTLLTHKGRSWCFSPNTGVVDGLSLKWLAGSLTAGNYIILGEPPLRLFLCRKLSEGTGRAVEICEKHVISP